MRVNEYIRYEPDERCPAPLTLGVAVQGTMISLSITVIVVTIFVLGAGEDRDYLSWAVFAALMITGLGTLLVASRLGKLGAGHILMMASGGQFIGVCVVAMTEAGPATLAMLLVVSSVLQFLVATWLPKMRRIITPVVAGTAHILIATTVIPVAIARLVDTPAGTSPSQGLAASGAAALAFLFLVLRGTSIWRLWAIPIGIGAGSLVAAAVGLYDFGPVLDTPWFDLPDSAAWPGLDLTPGPEFWGLLPMFLIVSLVVAVKSSSDGAVIQQVSRRQPRATDFRTVQGTLNVSGVTMLLSGIAGTVPPIMVSASSISLINLTGVASRRVGQVIGGLLILLALFPKGLAVLLAAPTSVMGAVLLMIMGVLLVEGMRTIVKDGLDHRKGMVAGASLALGIGLESNNVLEDLLAGTWGVVFGSGLVVGVLAVVVLTSLMELSSPRRKRLEVELDMSDLPSINTFLTGLATRANWSAASTERLTAAGEETLSTMLQLREDYADQAQPRLILTAQGSARAIDLEFMAIFGEGNIEDHLAYLVEHTDTPDERDVSFRLLRHYASSVRHSKYYGIDIVSVQVESLPES